MEGKVLCFKIVNGKFPLSWRHRVREVDNLGRLETLIDELLPYLDAVRIAYCDEIYLRFKGALYNKKALEEISVVIGSLALDECYMEADWLRLWWD